MEISRELIGYLKLGHGSFNVFIMLLFVFQAGMGLRIRRLRRGGSPDFALVKRHRAFGPVAAAIGIAGYAAGILLVLLDERQIMKYPLHFACGSLIVICIVLVVLLSRRIAAGESSWRDRHLNAGRLLLFLYGLQVFLGLGILL